MEIALRDFLADYGQSLKQKVIEAFKPLFNPSDKDAWNNEAELKLSQLKRKLFPAQTNAVLALAKGFFVGKKRGLILVAEMGSGKTAMAIAVAHLMHKRNYRVIVMCPPHLVRKWMREIEIVLPKSKVVNLNGKGLEDMESLRRAGKPTCPEFYVIGRERAKGHYSWKTSVFGQKHLNRILCPKCGKELDDALKSQRPRCPGCNEPLYMADKDGIRRFAKAEYIKKYLRGKIDLFVADEIHECKSGVTAQGQAFADIACVSKRTLALTGTLMGGYAANLFYLLWRLMPREIKAKKMDFRSPMGFAEQYGIIQRTFTETKGDEYTTASIGRSRGTRTTVTEKPGVSPLVLIDFLLEHTVFLRLPDVSNSLPPFNERIVEVAMTPYQEAAYKDFEMTLSSEVKRALARQDRSLLGALVNSLLAYPDGARKGEIVLHPRTQRLVAEGPMVMEHILPKEDELLNIIASELSAGRKCLICLEHTGTRDLIPDLQERILEKGFNPLILRSDTVSTEKREEWVKSKLESGEYNVMITNPNLIKTGLDLLEFPTIIFFQTGYSIFTLRQASRRSWRIGQDQPVRVFYLFYAKTMQSVALSLIATKMETALAIEGDLSDRGLTALAEGANSMLIEMARVLTGEQVAAGVSDSWKRYKKKELVSDSFMGDEVIEAEVSTTTFTNSDHSTNITYEKIVRGKVFPRNGYAVAIVDKHKFFFKAGRISFNGKSCGNYDKKGMGTINNKTIQIMKAEQSEPDCYVLVEIR